MRSPTLTRVAAASLLALLVIAIPSLLYIDPVSYLLFILEDSLGEMTSFTAFAVAGIIFARRFSQESGSGRNYWFLLFAIIAFFLAGEEISWGQRIVGIGTPEFLREINVQGEINLHNLSESAMQSAYLLITASLFLYGGVLPAVVRWLPSMDRLARFFRLPIPDPVLIPLYAAPLLIWVGPNIVRNDEIVELVISLSMFGLAFRELPNLRWLQFRSAMKRPAGELPLFAGIAFCFLFGSALAQFTSYGISYERQMFVAAKYQLPNAGYISQASTVLDHLKHNAEFADSPLFLATMGRIEHDLGRHSEAAQILERARNIAIEQLPSRRGELAHVTLLAEIHTLLDDHSEARRYANVSLGLLASAEGSSDDDDATPGNVRARHLIKRGNIFFVIEDYPAAFATYLAAAQVADWSGTKLTIARKLSQVVAECTDQPYRTMSWDEVTAIAIDGTKTYLADAGCPDL